MACVNRSLPEFQKLAEQIGDNIAEGLTIQNGYVVPSLDEAVKMIKANKVNQIKQAVQHINNTVSPSSDSFLQGFKKIIQRIGDRYFVVKGNDTSIINREVQGTNLKFLDAVNKTHKGILEVSSDKFGMDDIFEKLKPFGERSKNRDWATPVEFAQDIFPQEYIDQYKNLWELASKLGVTINMNHSSVPFGASASYQGNQVHLSPYNIRSGNMDQLVETFNHELIHGLLNFNSPLENREYKIHSQLKPLFEKVIKEFDNGSEEVKHILAYIVDTSREYMQVTDFDNLDYDNMDKSPTIPNYEELITYALTNTEFAKFLDSIPSDNTKVEKGKKPAKTIWTELKEIIRNLIKSIVTPSILDDINKILDAHFDVSFRLKDMNERRKTYSNLSQWQKPVSFPKNMAMPGKQLFSQPNPETAELEKKYQEEKGLPVDSGTPITQLNIENSKRIADAYEAMKHEPENPEVKAAYEAMANETVEQFKTIQDAGYAVEIYNGQGEPYANSTAMINDVRDNKHQYILSTENDFGSTPITDEQRNENPLLRDSGLKDMNGKTLLVNDIFRYVHDFFGHSLRGNSFGPLGEENAWDVHSRMYTPLARRAMTTETRGQNSWVNFGPQMRNTEGGIKKAGDEGFLSVKERPYAEQKIGLLPEEFSKPLTSKDQYQVLSKYRDNTRFPFADLVYPDVVFANTKTKAEAKVAVNFYTKILSKFNSLFGRDVKVSSTVNEDGTFNIVVTYENGLTPKYFSYPTATMGEHVIADDINKDTPLTSLRHELLHEMLVKDIVSKFEEVNNKDNSANASSIDEVQRNRALDYSLEDVFYERVVESLERNPDNKDTFSMDTYGMDVTNRLSSELKGEIPTKEKVLSILDKLLSEGNNDWLNKALTDIFSKLNYENLTDITTLADEVGKAISDKYNVSKEIVSDDTASKINDFTKFFNEEYQGVLTRLDKITSAQPTYEVKVNQEALNTLANSNKSKIDETPVIGETNVTDDKVNEVKKNYVLGHIVDFLSSKFNIPFEYINDPEQKFSGKFSKGKIILNTAYVKADTPFHEVAHPVVEMMKQVNPELYNSLKNELLNSKEGQDELARVQQEYADSTPDEQIDEAIVSLIGKLSEQAYANTLDASKKGLFTKILDFIKKFLNELGFYTPDFRTNMSMSDVSDLLINPLYKYDFEQNQRRVALAEEYEQKATASANTTKFDSLVDNILTKLKIDSKTPGKTDEEKTRKYFSKVIAENIEKTRRDLQTLNTFTDAALFNMLALNKKFDTFKTAYLAKKTKTRKDIDELSSLLNQIEDHLALYNDTASLISVIKSEFPDDEDFIKDEFGYSLERERALTEDYKDWSAEVLADYLLPYMTKSINKALNGGDIFSVVPEETFNKEKERLNLQGITDKTTIVNAAAKQYIKDSLLVADKDSGFATSLFAGVLNSKDSIAQLIGLAVTDELTKALQVGRDVFHKLESLSRKKFGLRFLKTNEDFKKANAQYLRKVKVWTYVGMNKDGSKKYEYREHEAFHEEYKWDEFYNKKREDFEAMGPRPVKTDINAFNAWNAKKDAWFSANTVVTKNLQGKDVRIPNSSYLNSEFANLKANDSFFSEMYKAYKDANNRLGDQGLKYGIVPQKKRSSVKVSDVKKITGKGSLEALRDFIGEQEQVYYAQKIDGTQGHNVKSYFTHLLEPGDELDYNLLSNVAKFAGASYKFQAMSQIEPHAKIMKNFIGGNNILNMKQRQAYKKTSSGLSAFLKGEHIAMPTDAKKLNAQLNSYINDAFYGESMETEVKKLWGAQFKVWKTGDTSVNGGPAITTIDGFENLMKHTNLPNLDYSGFEWMKDREVGQYTVRMNQKDWNFSVKKTSDRLGLLTALNTLIINPTAAAVNIIRGKIETYVEASGGKFFGLKDAAYADAEYFKAVGSGDFFEDLQGKKPSFLSEMMIKYDAIQGELIDINGKTITPGLANKLFRRDNLFFMMNGGEHLIQVPLMIAVMNKQKVQLTNGQTVSLYEARKREYNGQLKAADIKWTEEEDRQFREKLKFVNKSLNGNYDKVDKAMFQRKWYGSMFLMYKKHIYNLLANRYRSGYVHLESGEYTEGYYRTFMSGVANQLKEWILNKKFTKPSFGENEKYAFRKIVADLAIVGVLIAAFKMFDDDDDDDEMTDEMALISRRLISESGQYTPFLIGSEFARIVKNPFAATNTIESYYKAIEQTIRDPHELYERSGSGYKEGDNKAAIYWGRALPGLKVIRNIQEPERLLQFYKTNSADFLKPSSGKDGTDK